MDTQLYGVLIVPAIVGLINVAKQTGLPNHFAPLLSVLFGVAGGVALQFSAASPNWMEAVIMGIGLGLSATGLYSGSTTVAANLATARSQSAAPTNVQGNDAA